MDILVCVGIHTQGDAEVKFLSKVVDHFRKIIRADRRSSDLSQQLIIHFHTF